MATQEHPSVKRVQQTLHRHGADPEIVHLDETARTALDAAKALGIEVGQVASSIVFSLPNGNPLLVITSGRHKVDTKVVADFLNVEKLLRADANFVRKWSGFAIGGVAPIGWINPPIVVIDLALKDYQEVWAAAGHPHAVFPTTFEELKKISDAKPMIVGE